MTLATTADLQYLVKVQDAQLKKLMSDVRATNRLIAQTGTTSAAAGAKAAGGFRQMDVASTRAAASVQRTGKRAHETDGAVKRLGERMRSLGKIAVLASGIGGLYGLERTIEGVAEATHNFEATQASLETQLQASGLSWSKYKGQIIDTLDAQGNLASFSRNDLEQSFTQLVRTTGSVTDALKLNALAVNLARGAHLSLDQSAKVVSRVYSGNVGILKRYGIVLGANVKSPLEALIALQAKFSGQGAAFGRTTAGEIARLQNSVGLLAIDFSEGLVPALSEAFTSLNLFATDRKTEARVHQLGEEFGHFLGGEIKSTIAFFKENWPNIQTGLELAAGAAKLTATSLGLVRDVVKDLSGGHDLVGPSTLIGVFVSYKAFRGAQAFGGAVKDIYGSLQTLLVRFGLVGAAQAEAAAGEAAIGGAAQRSAAQTLAANGEIIASNEAVAASAGEAAAAQGGIGAAGGRGSLLRGLGTAGLTGAGIFGGAAVLQHFFGKNPQPDSTISTPQEAAAMQKALKALEARGTGGLLGKLEDKMRGQLAAFKEHQAAIAADTSALAANEKAQQGLFGSIGKGFNVPTAADPAISKTKAEFAQLKAIVASFPGSFGAKFQGDLRHIGSLVANMVSSEDEAAVQARLQKLLAGAQAKLSAFQAKLASMRQTFQADWGTFADKALSAFDAETTRLEAKLSALVRVGGEAFKIRDGGQTPAERELAALQQIQTMRDAQRGITDARSGLAAAQATGDPNLIKAAQRALEDAQSQVKQAGLEKRAAKERKAADKALAARKKEFEAQRALEKEHFQQELDLLEKRLASGKESQRQAQEDILALFRRYHISYQRAGDDLGRAFATGMHESFSTVQTDIGKVNDAFKRLVGYRGALNKLSKAFQHFANTVDAGTGGGGGAGGGGSSGGSAGRAGGAFINRIEQKGRNGYGDTPAEAQAAAKNIMMKVYGMGGAQFSALKSLWQRESGWRWDARNAKSGAYGIPQSLPANKMASAGSDWRTNPITQIMWGLSYIRSRYGSPVKALQHENKLGWYAGGGVAPGHGHRDSVPAMLTPGEIVLNDQHQRGLARRLGVNATGQGLFSQIQHFADGGVVSASKAPPPPPPPGSALKDIRALPHLVRLLEQLEARVNRHGGGHLPGIVSLLQHLEGRWAARGHQHKIKGVVAGERRLYALLRGRHETAEYRSPIQKLLALLAPGTQHHHRGGAGDTGGGVSTLGHGPIYPLARRGRLIGFPGQGTHSYTDPPNNWESDHAVDIAANVGTKVLAIINGQIGSQFGSLGSSNPRFAGLRLHLAGAGSEFYYAHLSRFAGGLHPGQHVRAGQLLGYSGEANGVGHLHFADRPPVDPRSWLTRSHMLRMQFGGDVPGFGISDRVPALLTPGERVFSRRENQDFKRLGSTAAAGSGDFYWSGDIIVDRKMSADDVEDLLEGMRKKASRNALPKRGPRSGKRIGLA